ncbi:Putative oxidoreductase YteT precursor [Lacunisphaera limnophila]|uniref:Oxidoreductase YteT n=1 Tax=Lacunisphaera limnophila TaxID=1838286 RepID=A0A1D8AR11_9BACT|nr:Gfo/Idh/MocA family oxidoreductase [Lacunisphaera limnophila]AOS43284.1 Putative oxidoreductase YteT precursor [Lacunisphaera limnophila]
MNHPTPTGVDRRAFFKTLSAAGLVLGAAPGRLAAAVAGRRKRYAIVGLGSRYRMYHDAIEKTYPEHAELVGLCDKNPGRLALALQRSAENGAPVPRGYVHTDFDRMIAETKPDVVIVTTMDATHDDYLVRAMELGCDTVTEKPMTTTPAKAQRILDTRARTGKLVRVLFNYRYSPPRTQVKDILMSGEIGEVLSVDFQWLLNTSHGADYFRRWHGRKENSGGLMIHKATHHFDLVNWWLGAVPVSVSATGKREFYTPAMARRFGLSSHHDRCHTCPEKEKCGFFMSLADNPSLKTLYLDQEHHDGYFRDQCVFNPRIDIEDTMNVIVGYNNHVTLSYSLNAFNAWEGYQIAFNGTLGRLEHRIVEQVYVNGADSDASQGAIAEDGVTTTVIPLRGAPRRLEAWTGAGSHGGGDKLMLDDLFLPVPPADKYQRAADERAGAVSMLIGAAANQCFATGQPVDVTKLVTGLGTPEYAPMPGRTGPLPMPARARTRRG